MELCSISHYLVQYHVKHPYTGREVTCRLASETVRQLAMVEVAKELYTSDDMMTITVKLGPASFA
jgi:hypothetical protein